MRFFSILLVSIFLITAVVGCSNDIENEEIKNLNQKINEEMDTEVFLPQFDDLDLSFAYVSYSNNGEARSVDLQYSKNTAEDVVDHMEYSNIKILYGPYNTDVVLMFSFDKNYADITHVSGERVQVNEVEIVIQENLETESFQFHMFTYNNNRYVIGYRLDYFTEEGALDSTEEIIYSIFN
ncbi:hypothetical protein QA612_07475 [Evansella sp. AB-P1]|uniref:hypothetical protein n=1 Tax=Evansella sp. AB-P1 TaxID=3037653 RepID=UPI00241D3AD7|nr:hypothetical protein [Evansella sp. AB-P1]MDG5787331.1 hypothetical protein [Evansella sp. AB-P1]